MDVGGDCCLAWRDEETPWQGLDAWGQPVGGAHVSNAEYYDASECWELTFEPAPAETPALYVAGDWDPSPSAQWTPSASERAAFGAFLETVQALTESPEYHRGQYTKRRIPPPVFFQLPPADDPHNAHPTRFAAIGGSTLIIAYVTSNGQWALGTLLNDTAIPVGPVDTYDVVAVVDMDGDAFPEVIVHSDEGPAWNDIVLQLDNPYQRYAWSVVATGVLGGTI